MSSSYRSSHLHKGNDYDDMFISDARLKSWESIERNILLGAVARHFPEGRPRHLDFACGTGRIIGYVQGAVRHSTGIDISKSMVDIAELKNFQADYIVGDFSDLNKLTSKFEDQKYDLITAFRFFTNAEKELRESSLDNIQLLLNTGGIIMINNHLNSDSLLSRLLRILHRDMGGIGNEDFEKLCARANLQIVEMIGIGILPFRYRQGLLLQLSTYLDSVLRKFSFFNRLAINLVYVLRPVND